MTSANMIFTIVLLPLLCSALAGLFGRKLGDRFAMTITTGGLLISLVLSIITFVNIAVWDQKPFTAMLYHWITAGHLNITFGVMVDKLTAVMLIVVTGVSSMVHIYSIGYMSHDPSRSRFFSYLSLFTFTMLALVTAANLTQLFLGWEGVGLASYLLIGFWFERESANAAAIKAFVVNRVADVGLILAMCLAFQVFGSLNFSDIFASVSTVKGQTYMFFGHSVPTLELFCMLLLMGAMGKSAQFGFHTWLPDAMEGPTPVSALIHAATMVTAGVFLLCRMSPVFEQAPFALEVVAIVGAITALFAATIGLVQTDIKRVIAYSTCSQLGYMFFACGVSAYSAAMFHLMTHAFFKALLFLSAGSVIHAVHGEQEMFKMGGLRKILPITYALMWVGSLALAGIPPFAGFYSKDFILEASWMSGSDLGHAVYMVGTFAALLTAFYSFRVVFLTFHGKFNGTEEQLHHAHESPLVMTGPMMVLGAGAVVAGFIGRPLEKTDWWGGAIRIMEKVHPGVVRSEDIPWLPGHMPLILGLVGIAIAWFMYIYRRGIAKALATHVGPLYDWLLHKWYIDELYNLIFVRRAWGLGGFFWKRGDEGTIDRFGPNGIAFLTNQGGLLLRRLQTGYLYHYAFVFILGVLALMTWFMAH